jgi:hypothetical protein
LLVTKKRSMRILHSCYTEALWTTCTGAGRGVGIHVGQCRSIYTLNMLITGTDSQKGHGVPLGVQQTRPAPFDVLVFFVMYHLVSILQGSADLCHHLVYFVKFSHVMRVHCWMCGHVPILSYLHAFTCAVIYCMPSWCMMLALTNFTLVKPSPKYHFAVPGSYCVCVCTTRQQ